MAQFVTLKNTGTKSKILEKTVSSGTAGAKRGNKMGEKPDELKKLVAVATDLVLSAKLRANAIELIGQIGTHDALLALLGVAANEQLTKKERDLALKHAREIVKAGS